MNILHISPYLPALEENHAGGVCMGKEIETLKKHHSVYILSFVISQKDKELATKYYNEYHYLHRWTTVQRLLSILTHPWLPHFFAARSSHKFKKNIKNVIIKYNINAVHAEYASMGQYLLYIKKHFPHIKCILVEHDFTEQSYQRKISNSANIIRRLYYRIQLKQIHYYEKKYCTIADNILTFNNKDKNLIESAYAINTVHVINPYYGIEDIDHHSYQKKTKQLCFVGQMSRNENSIAALRLARIYNQIADVVPELKLTIIGNNPSAKLKSLENDMIRVTGYVEDIDEEIRGCLLGVFPLTEGAGIKLKVLRCLALGIPVITTRVGAEGIDEDGKILKIVETDEEFKNVIITSISDLGELMNWSQRGIRYVQEHFSWYKTEEILNKVYK